MGIDHSESALLDQQIAGLDDHQWGVVFRLS